jgi:hypothetical protein
MAKKRTEENLIEDLEHEIRRLKALNRHLQKQLKKHVRGYKEVPDEDDSSLIVGPQEPSSRTTKCPSCHRANLIEVEVVGRLLRRCDLCGHREKAIKLK